MNNYKSKMIKKHFFIFSLLVVFTFSGFSQIKKTLGSFSKVTGFDKIKIQLIASDENKIELSGVNAEQVELVTKNEELKVRMPLGKLLKGDDVTATIYFKTLSGVEANEGSIISSDENINATFFEIIAKERGRINLQVQASKISVNTSSGALVTLSGNTENIDVVATAGGSLQGKDCKTQQATVTVNAGGTIAISAYDIVEAKARAGGRITVYGKPKQVNQKTILGGNIQIIKDVN